MPGRSPARAPRRGGHVRHGPGVDREPLRRGAQRARRAGRVARRRAAADGYVIACFGDPGLDAAREWRPVRWSGSPRRHARGGASSAGGSASSPRWTGPAAGPGTSPTGTASPGSAGACTPATFRCWSWTGTRTSAGRRPRARRPGPGRLRRHRPGLRRHGRPARRSRNRRRPGRGRRRRGDAACPVAVTLRLGTSRHGEFAPPLPRPVRALGVRLSTPSGLRTSATSRSCGRGLEGMSLSGSCSSSTPGRRRCCWWLATRLATGHGGTGQRSRPQRSPMNAGWPWRGNGGKEHDRVPRLGGHPRRTARR